MNFLNCAKKQIGIKMQGTKDHKFLVFTFILKQRYIGY